MLKNSFIQSVRDLRTRVTGRIAVALVAALVGSGLAQDKPQNKPAEAPAAAAAPATPAPKPDPGGTATGGIADVPPRRRGSRRWSRSRTPSATTRSRST